MGLNQAQNEGFCHLLEFGSKVFLEIEYSLQQRLASGRGKAHKKSPIIGTNGPKLASKLGFWSFSQVWLMSRGKTYKKNWVLELAFLLFSQVCIISSP